jgi:SAM-dependent methyltransferase
MVNIDKIITAPFVALSKTYKKLSTWGKVLLGIILLLIAISYYKTNHNIGKYEGFQQTSEEFVQKTGLDVYDDFYADIYDYLVYNNVKNDYEIGEIVNKTDVTQESRILDIGCGSGHHTGNLQERGFNIIGLDNSQAMIKKAQENYPKGEFINGNALDPMAFQSATFSHILCMYFTLYYMKDKMTFFHNCFTWLQPTGVLIVHLVERDQFNPILPPGNPLTMLTPQRYAKERITHTNVTFKDFKYNANFELNKSDNTAKFVEKFKNRQTDKAFRRQEHVMYMEPEEDILEMAKQVGFIVEGKIDLIKATYEYQYLYILKKPN